MPRRGVRVLVCVAMVAACVPLRRTGPPPAEIVFANRAMNQADVFTVSRSGARVRLGSVMAGQTVVLRVPVGAEGGDRAVEIVARIVATAHELSTGLVTLGPGERLAVTLPLDERLLSVLPAREP